MAEGKSKKQGKKKRKGSALKYRIEGIANVNKCKRLIRHAARFPNDKEATKAWGVGGLGLHYGTRAARDLRATGAKFVERGLDALT